MAKEKNERAPDSGDHAVDQAAQNSAVHLPGTSLGTSGVPDGDDRRMRVQDLGVEPLHAGIESRNDNGDRIQRSETDHEFLDRIKRDAAKQPDLDQVATKRWPELQKCLRTTLTRNGKPRKGGDIKTEASGVNYVTTLTMPEEGYMLRVVHNTLSKAWDALEGVLTMEPVPWVECSEYALKRRKIKEKPKPELD